MIKQEKVAGSLTGQQSTSNDHVFLLTKLTTHTHSPAGEKQSKVFLLFGQHNQTDFPFGWCGNFTTTIDFEHITRSTACAASKAKHNVECATTSLNTHYTRCIYANANKQKQCCSINIGITATTKQHAEANTIFAQAHVVNNLLELLEMIFTFMWRHGLNCATTLCNSKQRFSAFHFSASHAHKPEFHGTIFVSSFDWNNGDFFYYRRSSRLVYGLITDRPVFLHTQLVPTAVERNSPTVSHDSSTPPSTHLRHNAYPLHFLKEFYLFFLYSYATYV